MFLNISIWDLLEYFGVKPIDIVIITFIVVFILLILVGPAKIKKKCANKKPSVNNEDTDTKRIGEENSLA